MRSSAVTKCSFGSPSLSIWLAFFIALLCCLFIGTSTAHMIELQPSHRECFFEDLNPGDQMTLTYQVGGGGHLDIDTWLQDPAGNKLFALDRKDTGTYSFTAQNSGKYTYCFSNDFSTVSDKTVSFNVHGIIYVPDDGEMLPIEREIRDLAAALQQVKDEQEYLVIRERVHRNTAESTNSRVKWWSILQGIMLIGVCGIQVFFVKRQFEVRGSTARSAF
ncbi:supernatant protein factor, C-terminal domain-containing protein [Ceraceosorus guamensis]|uniref:Supernatant protein factor, C-terminal domain-containing protein n=1 Tax=Ceraceosorus guamensis TaxID=1522189 RepID=A0A316VYG7_9BASI|nr:supernatant protein factor, C-terminal domain-containing protein [Ceraceosorus guamensis]PWN42707.1 supernatant protein factor, C-terminal domain-containing protein [Ceraceosorus guamensis]